MSNTYIECEVAGDKGSYLWMKDGSIWLHPWNGAAPIRLRESQPNYANAKIAAIGKRYTYYEVASDTYNIRPESPWGYGSIDSLAKLKGDTILERFS